MEPGVHRRFDFRNLYDRTPKCSLRDPCPCASQKPRFDHRHGHNYSRKDMSAPWDNSFGTTEVTLACLALMGGILGARKSLQIFAKVGRRELAVFTSCYLIWIVMGPKALDWKYPEITIWFLIDSSMVYLPILIVLALRFSSQKKSDPTLGN
jgi:hypothetical protein